MRAQIGRYMYVNKQGSNDQYALESRFLKLSDNLMVQCIALAVSI